MASPLTPPGPVEGARIDLTPSKRRRLRYRALVEARERARIQNKNENLVKQDLGEIIKCDAQEQCEAIDMLDETPDNTEVLTPRCPVADIVVETSVSRAVQTDEAPG